MTARPYRLLARFYDALSSDAPARNRHARAKALGPILRRAESICDLGCGTGSTAVDLARAGHEVFAVDFSPEMCRVARAKAKRTRARVRVSRGDARTFRLPKPVDLVLCEFNPLNHLPRKADLVVAFRAVARALKPGGHFFFDVNTPLGHTKNYAGVYWMEGPGYKLALRARLDRERGKGILEAEWFVKAGKLWRHERERVDEVSWTDAEIRRALRAAGFEGVRTWDGVDVRPPTPGAHRGSDAYYLARKRAPAR